MKGNLHFKIEWASLLFGSKFLIPFLLCFTLYLRAIFQVQAPGGLYLEGRFNGGFFALPVWRAYIWRDLYTWRGLFSEFYFKFLTNSETCPLHREGQKMITNGRDQ